MTISASSIIPDQRAFASNGVSVDRSPKVPPRSPVAESDEARRARFDAAFATAMASLAAATQAAAGTTGTVRP